MITLDVTVGKPLCRGPISLFPLLGSDAEGPSYVSGVNAAGQGMLDVQELEQGASVPELVIGNRLAEPVLLLEGETIVGVRQNRTLNVTVLLAGGSRTTVPVSCVEAGRWGSARAPERSPRHAPARLRAGKVASVAASVRASGGHRSDQGGVWAEVDRYADALGAAAPTRAMEDVFASRQSDVAALVGGTRPLDGQRGVAAAAGGRVVAVDVFDRHSTLADYWEALVAGYALDALGVERTSHDDGADGIDRLMSGLAATRPTQVPGRSLGIEWHAVDPRVVATALEWGGRLVHVAAFPPSDAAPGRRRNRWFSTA